MVFVVGVELDVAEVEDDSDHLPDALHGAVRKFEGPEGVHDHPELVRLLKSLDNFSSLIYIIVTYTAGANRVTVDYQYYSVTD